MHETYYTPEEVAERLRVHLDTVRRWLRDGELRGMKVGKREWRVSERDIEAYMNSKANRANTESKMVGDKTL